MTASPIHARQSGVSAQDTDERARAAVKVFRGMQPGLSSFARVLTGNRNVRVELAQGGPRTDGTRIFYRPPIRLGDRLTHDRSKCDIRGEGNVQSCPACAVREEVMIQIYHEISHIAFGSFNEAEEQDKRDLLARALEEYPSRFRDQVKARVEQAPAYIKNSYMGLAGIISEFLPHLVNALEDCRIDNEMFRARRGTKKMFDAMTTNIFEAGIEMDDGTTIQWRDQPQNAQALVGVFCIGSEYDFTGWFCEPVETALRDEVLTELVREAVASESASMVYRRAFPVLARLRELGFCKTPYEDDEDDETDDADGQDSPDDADAGDDPGTSDAAGEPEDSDQDSGSDTSDQEGPDPDDEQEVGDGDAEDDSDGAGGADDPGPDSERDEDPSSDDAGGDGSDRDEDDGGAGEGAELPDHSAGSDDPVSADEAVDSEEQQADDAEDGADQDGQGVGDQREEQPDAGGEEAGQGEDGAGEGAPSGEGQEGAEASDDDRAEDSSGASGSGAGAGAPSGDDDGSADPLQREDGDGDSERGRDRDSDGPDAEESDGVDHDEDSSGSGDDQERSDHDNASPGDAGAGDAGGTPQGPGPGGHLPESLPDASSGDESDEGSEPDGSDASDGDASEAEEASPVDSGADEGKGGAQSDMPEMGTAQDMEGSIEVFAHHGDIHDFDARGEDMHSESDPESKALDRAIIQGLYFEQPSVQVTDVSVFRYGDTSDPEEMSGGYFGWRFSEAYTSDLSADQRYHGESIGALLGSAETVTESVLGPATLHARRTFDDNLRADRQKNMRSGKIRSQALGKRAWSGDDRLFGKKTVPGKKSYSVLIGIDISGSTVGENILLAKRAAWAQAELCQRVGIEFAIYAHTTSFQMELVNNDWTFKMHMYEVKSFDDEWTPDVQQHLLELAPSAGNLDGHSVEFYRKIIERRPTTDKIVLYYSDGKMPAANHDEELEVLQREIKFCRTHGITLMGVGIRTDSPARHGLDTVQIDSDEDLANVVSHLGKKLTNDR